MKLVKLQTSISTGGTLHKCKWRCEEDPNCIGMTWYDRTKGCDLYDGRGGGPHSPYGSARVILDYDALNTNATVIQDCAHQKEICTCGGRVRIGIEAKGETKGQWSPWTFLGEDNDGKAN